jgi:hypothetical protein
MFNPFCDVTHIKAEVFTSIPAKFRDSRRTKWSDPNLQGKEVVCSIEGREGISHHTKRRLGSRRSIRWLAERFEIS